MEQDPDSRGKLIRDARVARGWTQAQLAKRVETSQQHITRIEKGDVNHGKFLRRIAVELGLDPSAIDPDYTTPAPTIIEETELRSKNLDFPVHAAAEGGPGELIVSTDPVQWVLRPSPLVGISRAYGVYVVGESMFPEFRPGDIALINPLAPPERDETYVFYAENEHLGEARATIKYLLRWTTAHWYVRQWNPARDQKQDFTLQRDVWRKAHKVVGRYRT